MEKIEHEFFNQYMTTNYNNFHNNQREMNSYEYNKVTNAVKLFFDTKGRQQNYFI